MQIDYEKVQANVAGPGATDNWNNYIDPETGLHTFARHNNKVNVMYTDGSLNVETIDDIDPDVVTIANRKWIPAN